MQVNMAVAPLPLDVRRSSPNLVGAVSRASTTPVAAVTTQNLTVERLAPIAKLSRPRAKYTLNSGERQSNICTIRCGPEFIPNHGCCKSNFYRPRRDRNTSVGLHLPH